MDIDKLHEPRDTHSPSLWVLMSKGGSSDNVRVEGELVFTVVSDEVSVSGGKSSKLQEFEIHVLDIKFKLSNKFAESTLLPSTFR